MTLNKVLLVGNLTRDPELRETGNGKKLTEIGLAVNRRFKAEGGADKDEVCFINVVAWGKQAEAVCQFCKKGSRVFIEGRLQYDSWEKDGEKKSTIKVNAEKVQFIGKKADGEAKATDPREDDIPF